MTRAVVFAGLSFVGRPLCARLRRLGVDVVATQHSALSTQHSALSTFTRPLTGLGSPETCHSVLIACDLTDGDQVANVMERERPDWVIQCAGATHTTDACELYGLHVGGTRNVLSAVARLRRRRLYYCSVVPPNTVPLRGSITRRRMPVLPAHHALRDVQAGPDRFSPLGGRAMGIACVHDSAVQRPWSRPAGALLRFGVGADLRAFRGEGGPRLFLWQTCMPRAISWTCGMWQRHCWLFCLSGFTRTRPDGDLQPCHGPGNAAASCGSAARSMGRRFRAG